MSNPDYKNIGEVTARAIEEMADLTKNLCKAERLGWFTTMPDGDGITNLDDVKYGMDTVVDILNDLSGVITNLKIANYAEGIRPDPLAVQALALFHLRMGDTEMALSWMRKLI